MPRRLRLTDGEVPGKEDQVGIVGQRQRAERHDAVFVVELRDSSAGTAEGWELARVEAESRTRAEAHTKCALLVVATI